MAGTLLPGQISITDALIRVVEASNDAYLKTEEWDRIDLTAKAWVWRGEQRFGYDRRSRAQSMWLKDAVKLAVRSPSTIDCIEYETQSGGTAFLTWKEINEIHEKEELWRK